MRIKQTLVLLIFMVSLLGLPGIAAAKTDKVGNTVSKTDNNVVTTTSDKIVKKDTVKTSPNKQKHKNKNKKKTKHKKKHNTKNSKGGKGRK